jgi:hypothetical protein
MQREIAIGKIVASCDYSREEVVDLLDVWAEAKEMNFSDNVPDSEIEEIIEEIQQHTA